MRIRNNQSGMAIVEAVLILVIVGLIGVVGYKVYSTKQNADESAVNSSAAQAVTPAANVSKINSTADLDKAEQTLDATNPDDSTADLDSMNSQLNAF